MTAVIGKTTIGLTNLATAKHGSNTNRFNYHVGPYMASEDGVIDSMSLYTETTGVDLRLGVYLHDETTNLPTTLVAQSNTTAISTGGWQTLVRTSGTGVIEKGKRYWPAFMSQSVYAVDGVNGEITCKLDNTEELMWRSNFASGGLVFPNPQSGTSSGSTHIRGVSAYFTYTPTLPPAEDTSLQARINRASPGDTIRVRAGLYNEHLRINKPLKLVGVPDRRGRLPIIQGGTLIENWLESAVPEHVGKNVWYKDISINGVLATWVRSLQLDEKGVQVLQYHPLLAGEGGNESQATGVREHVLESEWSHSPLYALPGESNDTIDFWQWYDAIACHERISTSTGRLWLRLKNNANPNDSTCYATLTQNTLAGVNGAGTETRSDLYHSNEIASTIKCENQADVTIRNLEIRGGRYGIDVHSSSNVTIETCKIVTPAMRNININNCTNVTIQRNEITANPTRTNIGPGFGGTTQSGDAGVRARAMAFGWHLNKKYSTSGHPAPSGHSIELSGVTSGVTIRRNWMHGQGSGIGWGYGTDIHMIDAVIENNLFEKMDSTGVVVYTRATGTIRNNIFYEVHLNFRIQGMMDSAAFDDLNNLVTIENNYIHSLDAAGYVLQAHYSGTHVTYSWTTPIVFNNNYIQNVSTLIANVLGFADVEMDNNVIDTVLSFPTAVVNNGMESFTNNWVGGNAQGAQNQLWWGAGNNYQASPATRRLVGTELPVGWEQVGTYRQNVGLPIRRRAILPNARTVLGKITNPNVDTP